MISSSSFVLPVLADTFSRDLSLTAAQRLIERYPVVELGEAQHDQTLLGAIQGALCVQNTEIVVDSLFIACRREAVGYRKSIDQRFLCRYLLVHRAPHGKGIGHFPEGRLDGLLILGNRHFLFYFSDIVCKPGAGVKNRHDDLWGETPYARAGFEKTR